MYKKLYEKSSLIETKFAKSGCNRKTSTTMNRKNQYSECEQLLSVTNEKEDALNQSCENNRVYCDQNQLSRTFNKPWLGSLALFKTNDKQYEQKQQQKQYQKHHHQPQRERQQQWWLLLTIIVLLAITEHSMSLAKADDNVHNEFKITATTIPSTQDDDDNNSLRITTSTATALPLAAIKTQELQHANSSWLQNSTRTQKQFTSKLNTSDSIFLRFAKRFAGDNNLWSGIVQDCYGKPTFSCFQKNIYYYLNDVLDLQDVNVTQRLKMYKNQNSYQYELDDTEAEELITEAENKPTQSSLAKDSLENEAADEENEIPYTSRSFAASNIETPIEEVTNALYGKSVKFAMTHDIELKLPEMMFDGATFRISPQAIEGNGVVAKLELIPKQQNEARLAGKFLMKKLQKFLKSKLLLSFLALVLIIKIIKVKLFWLLPLVIGVGAAKQLLLKFLLFLFPALSHLFKLCSYYQQTYHSTKYHHHHHHINHHHTVAPPPWHSGESHHIPDIIYTQPPKGHISAYLHGAPIHETYGPPSHEHFGTGWANSGPGLGSEYISEVNRVAHVDDKNNLFNPHSNDANELHAWGLGTTTTSNAGQNKRPLTPQQQQLQNQNQRLATTVQKPSFNTAQQPQNYHKPLATSQTFNPFIQSEQPQQKQGNNQSFYNNKYRNNNAAAQSAPRPVYTPVRQQSLPPLQQSQLKPQLIQAALSQAAQIAAQYDPTRNKQQQSGGQIQQPQQQLTPEHSAQLKEAIRIQAEQRIVQQQQQILDKQPFVQDGQPIMPLNYDPFYSPILLKIDKIVEQLGVTDDLCKERLVCSMYKDPQRYSPHSNFVSAELSRDTNELQPITNNNQTVLRFFRLIQAARDGQDQKDCLTLYPNCNINTERK